ncbi:hypothetical protein D9M71_395790 [compost metagenome]
MPGPLQPGRPVRCLQRLVLPLVGQQGAAVEVVDPRLAPRRTEALRRHREVDVIEQHLAARVRVGGTIANRKVDGFGPQVDDFLRGMDVHHDGRMGLVETGQARHQPTLGERPGGGELDGVPRPGPTDQGEGLGDLVEAIAKQGEDRLADRREGHGPPPLQQFLADSGLQLAYLVAHCGDGHGKLFCGGGKAPVTGDRFERSNRVQRWHFAHGITPGQSSFGLAAGRQPCWNSRAAPSCFDHDEAPLTPPCSAHPSVSFRSPR